MDTKFPIIVGLAGKETFMDKPAFTIKQFCYAFNISRSFLYKLWSRDEGPRYFKVGGSVRISHEAAEAWRAQNEVTSSAVTAE